MRKIILALGVCGGLLGQTAPASADSGFVGSSQWFKDTRQVAQDQAIQRSLSRDTGGGGAQAVPAGYVGFSGQVVCPGGNPFPGGQFPDLRINDRNRQSDGVERAPHVAADGTFSTVFKRGDTYDFSWMYWMGGRELFATVVVASDCPSPCQATLTYRHGQTQITPVMAGGAPTPNAPDPSPANSNDPGADIASADLSAAPADSAGGAGQMNENSDAINEPAGSAPQLKPNSSSAPTAASGQQVNPKHGRIGVTVDGTGHVTRLLAGAPAVTAGLQVGDQIIGIGKYSIETGRQLTQVLAKLNAGQKVRIRFIRAGQIQTLTTVAKFIPVAPAQVPATDAPPKTATP